MYFSVYSHMGIVAMEILWSLCLVVVLVSVHPVKARGGLQGQSGWAKIILFVSCRSWMRYGQNDP